jgi:sporulation protein YlmC with PRC-barrel domain
MKHYGTLGDYQFSETDAEDIRGSHVYGLNDEKLGKIEDVIFDHPTGDILYAIVDTGGWLSSHKFVVPAYRLKASDKHKDDYETALSKSQIESFPPYNEKDIESHESWQAYEQQYQKAWKADPVLHREGSDRDVTPNAAEVPAPAGSAYIGTRQPILDVTPRRIASPEDDLETPGGGTDIGGRWLSFEDRLRQRRREVTLECTTCAESSEDETASERERDELRKTG